MHHHRQVLVLGVVVALSGCGGGGKSHAGRSSATAAATSGTASPVSTAVSPPTTPPTTPPPAASTTVPAAPTGLAARRANVRSIALTWTDASNNEAGFTIERRPLVGAGPFVQVASVAANVVTHRDLAPDLATFYEYRVLAFNAVGASPPSNVASVETGGGQLVSKGTLFGAIPRRVAVGDFDRDGDVDVATAYEDPSTPDAVFWNDGAGVLTDSGQAIQNSYSSALLSADLDGDGYLDLVYGNGDGSGMKICWNNVQGTFYTTAPNYEYSYPIRALAALDVDGDQDTDLIVGRNGGSRDVVYLQRSNRDFVMAAGSLGVTYANAIVTGDVNGDTRPDVLIGGDAGVQVWLNAGAGAFSSGHWVPLAFRPYALSLALGDLDGDRDLDLVVGGLAGETRTFVGDNRGNFAIATSLPGSVRETWGLALGDMDGDGDLDLANGKGDATPWSLLYTNDSRGIFALGSPPFLRPLAIRDLALADMDGDGDLDIVAADIVGYSAPPATGGVGVYENR